MEVVGKQMPCIHSSDKQIGAFFDKCARNGDMAAFLPEELATLEHFLTLWNIQPGQGVLEPGCGSGRLTAHLVAAVGPSGRVLACDLSPEMIRCAKEHALPPQAQFAVQSLNTLGEPDESFDHVLCVNVFPHFCDRSRALAQITRVLKPGGHLWVNHFEGREGLNRFHRDAAAEVAEHVLPDELAMRRLVEGAGLEWLGLTDGPDFYALHARKPAT
jgi:ubiquinone/menaquinone biosynthesis C-methylase UbiE